MFALLLYARCYLNSTITTGTDMIILINDEYIFITFIIPLTITIITFYSF